MTTLTVHHLMSGNPIPAKSDVLFAVTLDSCNPIRPFDDDRPERAPHQLTFGDAEALLELGLGKRQAAMFESSLIIELAGAGDLPFEAGARVTSSDFFAMFDVPFVYGSGWDRAADETAEPVVVLTLGLESKRHRVLRGLAELRVGLGPVLLELDSPGGRGEFVSHLDAYVEQQKLIGRFMAVRLNLGKIPI